MSFQKSTPAEAIEHTIRICREKGIVLPTIEQLRNPQLIPAEITDRLRSIKRDQVHPLNLFRVNWFNDPDTGAFMDTPAFVEIPPSISGVKARILIMSGKHFPTGCHKVGATYCGLIEALTSGSFDPTNQVAIWPSTGNYCRGGAFNSALLGCKCIGILPEAMSRERYEWLGRLGADIVKTPGGEANVKEIFDAAKKLVETRPDVVNFNQFEMMGNPAWHYNVTGPSLFRLYEAIRTSPEQRLFGSFFTTGSAGAISAAEFLKRECGMSVSGAGEAVQCPTMLINGFGEHDIEGIGDKHIPWVFNPRNQDVAIGVDDRDAVRGFRLFNEKVGHKILLKRGVPQAVIDQLSLLGISGVANMIGCIKMAKYYECTEDDILVTVATDSAEMYGSRLEEYNEKWGAYNELDAAMDFAILNSLRTDFMEELGYRGQKRIHGLKYFTWVEQQGKKVEELEAQWSEKKYWTNIFASVAKLDEDIRAFNERTGVSAEQIGVGSK